jgi:TolB-like protein/DNA-binding winged helix-turn-helix (wHTH) protein/Tfp pilus assembly protein PilF
MSTPEHIGGYEFENFLLDKRAHALSRAGTEIPLTPKEFQTLLVLVESAGTAVAKETLLRAVWSDTFVTDSSLTRNISILRKHLGDGAIHTVSKHGYRFAYSVIPLSPKATKSSSPFIKADLSPETPSLPGPTPVLPRSRPNLPPIYWIAAASVACLALVLASVHLAAARPEPPLSSPQTTPTRLAVLPFRNLSPQPNTDYLANGLAEDLITTLSQWDTDRVRVLAASSSRLYAGTDKPAAQIARELNAQYLVDGTIQTQDQQLILTVHLIDGHDQTMLWSGKFPRPLVQLQQMQTDIAESIAREIQVRIVSGSGVYAYAGQTQDPMALKAYLHGRFELEQKNVPAFYRALDQFGAAVDFDPRYARAYAGIAEAYLDLAGHIPNRPAYAQAKAAALHAIQLDSQLAEAHRDLGWVYYAGEANAHGAEDEFRRALALNPSDARTHHWYAQLLITEHKTSAALAEAKQGSALDPLSLGSNYNYSLILIYAGQPEEGIRHLDAMVERDPNSEILYNYLGRAFSATHHYARAAECFHRAMELSQLKSHEKADWAYALARAGDSAQARQVVNELEATWKGGAWLPAADMTKAYIGLEDKDRAFTWLGRCVAERSCTLLDVNTAPFTDLSADPRFAQLTAPLYGPAKPGQPDPTLQATVARSSGNHD